MMKKVPIFHLILIIIFFTYGCGKQVATPQSNYHIKAFPVYVENDTLKKDGKTFLLHGVNIAESFKYKRKSSYDLYFGKITEEDFKWLRHSWGFNFARLLFEWYAFEPTEGIWEKSYISNYAKRVSWAAENGIYVLVDMHQDIYGVGFKANGAPAWTCNSKYYIEARKHWLPIWWMNYYQGGVIACFDHFWNSRNFLWKHFGETWRRIAEKFHNHPYVLGFEFLNEPFPGSYGPYEFEKNILFNFYTYLGRIIRKEAPEKLLFFEPSIMRGAGFVSSLPPLPFNQIVYSPHYYDPTIHQGGEYISSKKGLYYGILTDRLQEAKYQHAAMILGEYGAWGPDLIGTARYLNDLLDVADELKIGTAFWDFDFLKNKFNTFPQQFINAIARGYPEKWDGDLSYSYNYKNVSLKISWTSSKGSTLIVTLPILSFHKKIIFNGQGVSWNWINDYQIKIAAEKNGVHIIEIEKAH